MFGWVKLLVAMAYRCDLIVNRGGLRSPESMTAARLESPDGRGRQREGRRSLCQDSSVPCAGP
jgi:hypothetical protein